MTPQRPRFSYVERLADRLLIEAEIKGPPIPVKRIVAAQACSIRTSDLKDISGILVRSAKGNVIGVNKAHHETRKRFTIAHELGHLMLHQGQEVWYDRDFRVSLRSDESSAGVNVEEVEANFFAASLLMPNRMLSDDLRACSIDLEDVEGVRELARAYGVSPQAMTLRLARLIGRRGRGALPGKPGWLAR